MAGLLSGWARGISAQRSESGRGNFRTERRVGFCGHMWIIVDDFDDKGNKTGETSLHFSPEGYTMNPTKQDAYPNGFSFTVESTRNADLRLIDMWKYQMARQGDLPVNLPLLGPWSPINNCWTQSLSWAWYGIEPDEPVQPVKEWPSDCTIVPAPDWEEMKRRLDRAWQNARTLGEHFEVLRQFMEEDLRNAKERCLNLLSLRVVIPEIAIAGGTLVGTVLTADDQPVAATSIQVNSITGTVIDVVTDSTGRFTTSVPAQITPGRNEAGLLKLLVGGTVVGLVKEILTRPRGTIPSTPPSYVEPGTKIHVTGDYPKVAIETPTLGAATPGNATPTSPISLPTGQAIGHGGSPVITAVQLPKTLTAGPRVLVFTDRTGGVTRTETGIFTITRASIDQAQLRSGQQASYEFEFDFGPGPKRQVTLLLNTTGPIQSKESGRRHTLAVDETGRARFAGKVQALAGTPAGAPFSITPLIQR